MIRSILLSLALLAGLLLTPALAQKQKGLDGRTQIDRQDDATPEAAIKRFLEAFAQSDYVAAYFLLSPRAKEGFMVASTTFNLQRMFPGSDGASIPGSYFDNNANVPDDLVEDVLTNPALLFDNLVYAAERHGMLPIRVGEISLGAPTMGEGIMMYPVTNDGGVPAIFSVEVMILSNGRWRIDRIAWDQSEADVRPWGVPSEED